ncbi:hypothetical protein BC937DRAFT_92404 [Endogone sp. FLAS-F59071]|nr:hypothetical protein BC937DRAFT_92404 [Endogone sp. FLAS-F59071]|eukprot:RUS21528.1 hypothetical protein BC937DRAFT_92404 [Endogone sp. FLAS-F59071]
MRKQKISSKTPDNCVSPIRVREAPRLSRAGEKGEEGGGKSGRGHIVGSSGTGLDENVTLVARLGDSEGELVRVVCIEKDWGLEDNEVGLLLIGRFRGGEVSGREFAGRNEGYEYQEERYKDAVNKKGDFNAVEGINESADNRAGETTRDSTKQALGGNVSRCDWTALLPILSKTPNTYASTNGITAPIRQAQTRKLPKSTGNPTLGPRIGNANINSAPPAVQKVSIRLCSRYLSASELHAADEKNSTKGEQPRKIPMRSGTMRPLGFGPQFTMISFILLVNKQGRTRVSRYFTYGEVPSVDQRPAFESDVARHCVLRDEQKAMIFEYKEHRIGSYDTNTRVTRKGS